MTQLRQAYRDRIVALLDHVIATQEPSLGAAREAIVAALAANQLIHVAGSGHSHLLAEEVFYRAGGIAAAQAILDPDLMLHLGARRSTVLEREEGRAAKVLANYQVSPGDVFFVASNSGRNPYPIEIALLARQMGATTIALTSLEHARQVTSRHRSGKRLFEVTDLVIDNGGAYGDAALPIPGRDVQMGPTSTIAGVFILNSLLAEAVAELAAKGVDVDVYQSANAQGSAEDQDEIITRWQPRIKGL